MSDKLGTAVLAIAVVAICAVAGLLFINAASQPFAIQMAIMLLACVLFLIFIVRRSKAGFDQSQGR